MFYLGSDIFDLTEGALDFLGTFDDDFFVYFSKICVFYLVYLFNFSKISFFLLIILSFDLFSLGYYPFYPCYWSLLNKDDLPNIGFLFGYGSGLGTEVLKCFDFKFCFELLEIYLFLFSTVFLRNSFFESDLFKYIFSYLRFDSFVMRLIISFLFFIS